MPGGFSKATRPVRPGAYFNWIAQAVASVPPAVGSIVAIPFTSDWGPFKQAVLVESFAEYLSIFGPSIDQPGYRAAWQAFNGERGFDGRFGAGAVLCYRFGGSAAAKATKILTNTTPATALTLTAKYEGTYGNNLKFTTQDHASDATQNELLIYVGATLVETFVYLDTNIAALAADINANSDWVTAVANITGVALTAVVTQAATGGNDGTTTIAGDWTAMMAGLESQRFGVFVPYGLTDPTITASIKAWAAGAETVGSTGLNTKGKRFEVIIGGAANELNSAAITRSGTLNDGNFINLGQSSFLDHNLLDSAGNPVTLAPSEFAASFAGVLANRGEILSTTFARFPGVDLLNAPTESEILKAYNGGVVVFAIDSDPDAPMHVEKGITTYTNTAQAAYPYLIYRNPKFMRTMQNVEVEFTDASARLLVGKPVNNKTRDSAVALATTRMKARETAGIIQPGWTVSIDTDPPPSDDDEFIAVKFGLRFGRSAEQVFFTANVG